MNNPTSTKRSFFSPFSFLSSIFLSRLHLVLSALSQSDSQDIPASETDSQFHFKFNFGGNSVRIQVWAGRVVTNTGALLLA